MKIVEQLCLWMLPRSPPTRIDISHQIENTRREGIARRPGRRARSLSDSLRTCSLRKRAWSEQINNERGSSERSTPRESKERESKERESKQRESKQRESKQRAEHLARARSEQSKQRAEQAASGASSERSKQRESESANAFLHSMEKALRSPLLSLCLVEGLEGLSHRMHGVGLCLAWMLQRYRDVMHLRH